MCCACPIAVDVSSPPLSQQLRALAWAINSILPQIDMRAVVQSTSFMNQPFLQVLWVTVLGAVFTVVPRGDTSKRDIVAVPDSKSPAYGTKRACRLRSVSLKTTQRHTVVNVFVR